KCIQERIISDPPRCDRLTIAECRKVQQTAKAAAENHRRRLLRQRGRLDTTGVSSPALSPLGRMVLAIGATRAAGSPDAKEPSLQPAFLRSGSPDREERRARGLSAPDRSQCCAHARREE